MILGAVAIPREPRRGPGETDRPEQHEARSPAPSRDDEQRHRRRQHPTDARSQEHHAVGTPSLADRKPPREAARDVWKRACLTRAEQKADRDQRREPACRRRQHREGGPPQHDARQDAPRTDDVAEPSRGDLEQRIRQGERAEDDAHLEHAEVQVVDDVRRRGGDTDAIEVGDDREEKREAEHARPDTRSGHQGASITTIRRNRGSLVAENSVLAISAVRRFLPIVMETPSPAAARSSDRCALRGRSG